MIEAAKRSGFLLIAIALGAWLGTLIYGESEGVRNLLLTRLADATIGDILVLVVFTVILAK